jgi:hypothetical protein
MGKRVTPTKRCKCHSLQADEAYHYCACHSAVGTIVAESSQGGSCDHGKWGMSLLTNAT